MDTKIDKPFFVSPNSGFGRIDAKDELLHPDKNALVTHETLTETQYFGLCIPEESIHGFCYLWHHPNLHVVTGGLFIWRGHNTSIAHSLLCDYRSFMSDAPLANDLHEYRLINGYGVKVVEPLKRHHVTYADPKRQQSVDLHYEAVSPPVMFGDGNHFEQALKVKGELVLRGKHYDVNCYTVRDRSWAKPRAEDTMALPNITWMQGVFNDDFAFCCNMFDQEGSCPELIGTLGLPDDKTVIGGWIYRDGKVGRIVKGKKHISRVHAPLRVDRLELELTDEFDRMINVRGNSIASVGWIPWPNMYAPIGLMRWECEGMTAHGDCQEGMWSDYLNLI
jgi:hypothetical protein